MRIDAIPCWTIAAILGHLCGGVYAADVADAQQIQGEWRVISMVQGGIELEISGRERIEITESTITFKTRDDEPEVFEYRLDPKRSPKQIDCTLKLDPLPPVTRPGVYKLNEDELELNIAAAKHERPKTLKSRKGDASTAFRLKRVEPSK